MIALRSRQQPKHLDAGIFQAEINSFALRLGAEGKAAKTIRTYTEAVAWFAAAHLIPRTRCKQPIEMYQAAPGVLFTDKGDCPSILGG
jgi:hypothetical protein